MTKQSGNCPVCDASVNAVGAEVSEIITCPDCKNRLVVESLSDAGATLKEAPQIEEDWGE